MVEKSEALLGALMGVSDPIGGLILPGEPTAATDGHEDCHIPKGGLQHLRNAFPPFSRCIHSFSSMLDPGYVRHVRLSEALPVQVVPHRFGPPPSFTLREWSNRTSLAAGSALAVAALARRCKGGHRCKASGNDAPVMVTVNPVEALASPFPLAFFEAAGLPSSSRFCWWESTRQVAFWKGNPRLFQGNLGHIARFGQVHLLCNWPAVLFPVEFFPWLSSISATLAVFFTQAKKAVAAMEKTVPKPLLLAPSLPTSPWRPTAKLPNRTGTSSSLCLVVAAVPCCGTAAARASRAVLRRRRYRTAVLRRISRCNDQDPLSGIPESAWPLLQRAEEAHPNFGWQQIAQGIQGWRKALENGYVWEEATWPEESLCQEWAQTLNDLELPRFTRRYPELIDALLFRLLEIVVQLSEAMGTAADAAHAQGGEDDKSRSDAEGQGDRPDLATGDAGSGQAAPEAQEANVEEARTPQMRPEGESLVQEDIRLITC
eukprot:symbB.v1.2.006574.t1/scaffold362.1/size219673/6